ncbi:uncharacterized protein METZ01_LOCUS316168, partial [marine metagenome]
MVCRTHSQYRLNPEFPSQIIFTLASTPLACSASAMSKTALLFAGQG